MQQRRFRLGDILDDYCPRERRLTNHAIVAMVEDEVKQTRCTTCDTEHEYKQGKMPTLRRKKDVVSAVYKEVLAAVTGETAAAAVVAPPPVTPASPPGDEDVASAGPVQASDAAGPVRAPEAGPLEAVEDQEAPDGGSPGERDAAEAGGGRVHRRLIRATLPRPENHTVERPIPEFTMRQANDRGGRFRGGMARAAGTRPGGGGRGGGHSAGHGRGPVFGKPPGSRAGGHGGRPPGRPDANRPHRGGQPGRHGKKHTK